MGRGPVDLDVHGRIQVTRCPLVQNVLVAALFVAAVAGCSQVSDDPLEVSLLSDGKFELNGANIQQVDLFSTIAHAHEQQTAPFSRQLWFYRENPNDETNTAQQKSMDALFEFAPTRGLYIRLFGRSDFSPSSEILIE